MHINIKERFMLPKWEFLGIESREINDGEEYNKLKSEVNYEIKHQLNGNKKQALFQLKNKIGEVNQRREANLSIDYPTISFFIGVVIPQIIQELLKIKSNKFIWNLFDIVMLVVIFIIIVLFLINTHKIIENYDKTIQFYNNIQKVIQNQPFSPQQTLDKHKEKRLSIYYPFIILVFSIIFSVVKMPIIVVCLSVLLCIFIMIFFVKKC